MPCSRFPRYLLLPPLRQAEGGFIGDKVILAELPGKISDLPRRRVGLFVDGSPAREHATVHDPATQEQIGTCH